MKKEYISPEILSIKNNIEHILSVSEIPLENFGGGSGSVSEGGSDEIEVSSLNVEFD